MAQGYARRTICQLDHEIFKVIETAKRFIAKKRHGVDPKVSCIPAHVSIVMECCEREKSRGESSEVKKERREPSHNDSSSDRDAKRKRVHNKELKKVPPKITRKSHGVPSTSSEDPRPADVLEIGMDRKVGEKIDLEMTNEKKRALILERQMQNANMEQELLRTKLINVQKISEKAELEMANEQKRSLILDRQLQNASMEQDLLRAKLTNLRKISEKIELEITIERNRALVLERQLQNADMEKELLRTKPTSSRKTIAFPSAAKFDEPRRRDDNLPVSAIDVMVKSEVSW